MHPIIHCITLTNIISIIWNIFNLCIENLSINTIGILWIYNISCFILTLERYLPEFKNKKAIIFITSVITVGYLLSLILMFSEKYDINMILCSIFNILSYIISIIYFVLSKNM